MASKNTHIIIGAAAGLIIYSLYKKSKNNKWDFLEVCGALLAGGVIGIIPDLLEPPNSSYHRRAFHSLALLSSFLLKDKVYNKFNLNDAQKASLNIVLSSYASHLLADGLTPRGLPLI